MLRSWESDGNRVIEGTERSHYTVKGVLRRIRHLQAAGKYGHGESPTGSYIVAAEQVPGEWSRAPRALTTTKKEG